MLHVDFLIQINDIHFYDFEFRILLYVCFLCFLFILYAYFFILQHIDLDFRSMRHVKIDIIMVSVSSIVQ